MNVTVRPATERDAATLAAVAAATFALACPPHTTEEAKAHFIATVLSESKFAEYLADPARELILALTDDGLAVGYTMVIVGEPQDADAKSAVRIRPTSELSKCYVLAGHHGAGVSASLMEASVDAAIRRGAVGMWLGVNQLNERAQRFYRKHGFERVGTKRFLVGDQFENDFVMERPLESALSPRLP